MNITPLMTLIHRGHVLFAKFATYLQSPFLLIVRLYWGWAFFQTGLGKLRNLDATTSFFQELGIPLAGLNAAVAGATECAGGLLLITGLASRLTAIPLSVTMIVAYLTADIEAVRNLFSDPDQFLAADPFLFLFASCLVLAFGPGVFSMDRLIAWKPWSREDRVDIRSEYTGSLSRQCKV
jgi:putative oxidoreductase